MIGGGGARRGLFTSPWRAGGDHHDIGGVPGAVSSTIDSYCSVAGWFYSQFIEPGLI